MDTDSFDIQQEFTFWADNGHGMPPARPARTPVELTAFERELIDRARGDTPLGKYIREAVLTRAAYELGLRQADPPRTMLSLIQRLRRERP